MKNCAYDRKKVHMKLTIVKNYGLLTKRGVKMAGFLAKKLFIFFVSFWTKLELRSTNAILTEQAWSLKDLLYGKRTLFSCGT